MGKSKYEKVFPRLKPLPVDDMDYQQKADVVKQTILEHRGDSPTDDYMCQALVETSLDAIADEVKTICHLITTAPNGRQHGTVFGRYWLLLRRVEDSISQQLKNVRLLLYTMEQLGVEQFEVEGADSVKLDDLGRVKTMAEVVIKIRDKDKFRDWCVEQNLFRELNMHHSAATALTKMRLLNGDVEPEGVEAFFNIKFTK